MAITVEDLCRIDLFQELDRAALERVATVVHERLLEPGDTLTYTSTAPEAFYVVLEGELEGLVQIGGQEDREERDKFHVAPTWLGAIPILTDAPWGVTMRAWTPCRVGGISKEDFLDLLHRERSVEMAVMRTFRPVFQRVESITRQREKLAALGVMAAGLSHELNNPAAAARRAAGELADALEVVEGTLGAFVDSGIELAEAQQLVALQREAVRRAGEAAAAGAVDRSLREDVVAERLEEFGFDDPWPLAEPLAAAGVDDDWLKRVCELAGPAREAAVRWVAATLTARGLAEDLRDSTGRISELVTAVKQYSYMDRGEQQDVDVHAGLESTLTMLGHKLKKGDVRIVREYADELPPVPAHGSELNQVWTNLLDNAIAAVDGDGTVTIRTARARTGDVVVTIADDGPGIPEEVRDRVFDPFFTTKDVGEGTGLGLDTARRIVVDRHRGTLTVDDGEGGGAAAVVTLPVDGADVRPGV